MGRVEAVAGSEMMEFRNTRVLHGSGLRDVAGSMPKTRTYGAGRVCSVQGCGTRLSTYNPSSVCALHGGAWQDDYQRAMRKVSRREEISRRCAFDACSREFTTTNPAKKYCGDACRMRAFQARVTAARRMSEVGSERRAS